MKDLIVGCAVGYQPEHIKPWVESIELSGFQGDKFMIDFGLPQQTISFLKENGFSIFEVSPAGRHIVVERFYALYGLLSTLDLSEYRFIITTDVKDVIFQKNPSEWLERSFVDHWNKGILVSSECILYKDEEWGNNNLKVSYPHLYHQNKDHVIYNAGTIAGYVHPMKDLFLHIYHLSLIGGDAQPDQAALNILIHTRPFQDYVLFAEQKMGWCCQLGTSLDPKIKDKYAPLLLEESPRYDEEGLVWNGDSLFYLVHQYDRVPGLREKILKKYL
jgi:hypothetical protein